MALTLIPTGTTQSHTLIQGNIITHFGRFADNDAHTMINKKTTANFRARMNLNTREPAPHI